MSLTFPRFSALLFSLKLFLPTDNLFHRTVYSNLETRVVPLKSHTQKVDYSLVLSQIISKVIRNDVANSRLHSIFSYAPVAGTRENNSKIITQFNTSQFSASPRPPTLSSFRFLDASGKKKQTEMKQDRFSYKQ